MAKTIPLVPNLNVLEQDPISNLVLVGEITGSIPSGTTYANIFAKGCVLEATDTGDDWFMTGTTANPSWTVVTTGSGITHLIGDVTASGPGSVTATVVGLQGVDLSAALTDDASFYLFSTDSGTIDPVVMSGDVSMDNLGATTVLGLHGKALAAAASVNASFYVYDGTDFDAVILSGDATMTNAGVVTIADSAKVYTTKVTLTSLQILSLNGTPIQLLAAPTSGHVYQILSVTGRINFVTAAYATHTELDIVDTTTGNVLFKDASALLASASTVIASIPANANSNVGVIQTSAGAVSAKVAAGNPTGGSGTVDVYITYKIVAL